MQIPPVTGETVPQTRRVFLVTSVVGGLAALIASACGKATTKVDTAAGATNSSPSSTTGSTGGPTTTKSPSGTAGPTTATTPSTASFNTASPTTGSPTGATLALNAAQELQVSFSYVASATGGPGGKGGPGGVKNPYVAVWIEDAAAKAVRTLFLSFERGKGDKWLPELKRWYRDNEARQGVGGTDLIAAVSSATRVPGTMSVAWNGKSDAGQAVPAGNYFFCIEGSREHGPYSVIREELQLAGTPFEKTLTDNGELQHVLAKLVAR